MPKKVKDTLQNHWAFSNEMTVTKALIVVLEMY